MNKEIKITVVKVEGEVDRYKVEQRWIVVLPVHTHDESAPAAKWEYSPWTEVFQHFDWNTVATFIGA